MCCKIISPLRVVSKGLGNIPQWQRLELWRYRVLDRPGHSELYVRRHRRSIASGRRVQECKHSGASSFDEYPPHWIRVFVLFHDCYAVLHE